MFLDRKSSIMKRCGGNLPHWHQDETLQFVTFRLADSLPVGLLGELRDASKTFLEKHPKPWSRQTAADFRNKMGFAEERLLQQGFGSSIFRDKEYRKILSDCLMRDDMIKYMVYAYVIMPNHVHALILPYEDMQVSEIIGAVKRFSSKEINKRLGRTGRLWQSESFDHLVRSETEFMKFVDYIVDNPRNLREGEFEVYVKDIGDLRP